MRLVVTIVVSIPVGIIAAIRQYTLTDKVITIFATIGYAMPTFLIGIYILYFGAVLLYQWTGFGFPLFGFQSLGSDGSPLDIAYHLILPVTALAITSIAGFSRYLRASMLDVMRQDYVRTARAKGAGGRRVVGRHALRNALIPLDHPHRAVDPGPHLGRGHHRGDLLVSGSGQPDDHGDHRQRLPDDLRDRDARRRSSSSSAT